MKKKSMNRREFLRLSAAGMGTLLVADAVGSTLTQAGTDRETAKIPTRTLGRTGISLPVLSMGVMKADNPAVVRAAYRSGVVHFDTAHGYQNGRNEEMLGAFFADKPRDSFFIATKVNIRHPYGDTFETEFREKSELSLKRLRMDYVDLFYAHAMRSPEQVADPRLIAEMKRLKAEGKARFLGLSTHVHQPEVLDAAIEAGIYDVILLSYNFKLKNLPEMQAAIERAAAAGIGLVAMKTMTGGAADAEGKVPVNGAACLKWAWENPHITTAIPGFVNYDQLEDCLAAARDTRLTPDETRYLAENRDEPGMFCQQCDVCRGQCPKGLPIPDIMRAYMYAYGYKCASYSKETLAGLDLPSDMCGDCGSCSVRCPSGFRVADRIAAVAPIMQMPGEFLT